MAESTEQEQIKQTQSLETISKGQTIVSGKLDKVIAVLKEEGTQEALLSEMKEQDELVLKAVKGLKTAEEELITTTKKIQKQGEEQKITSEEVATETKETKDAIIEKSDEEKVLLEDAAKIASKGNDLIEAFKISQDESADQTASFQEVMKGVEKRKADLAKTALADQKRKDKLSTRAAKGAWDWAKGKGSAVVKATGNFFDNILKLIALLLTFFALSWLKGKNLKKMFEDFKKKVQQFIDVLIPQLIQDLDWGWQLGIAIGGLWAAWYALKKSVGLGGKSLVNMAKSMTKSMGVKSVLRTQLDDVVKQLDNLAAQKNILKGLHDLETDVGKKSKLATQIDDVEIKMKALTDQENALKRSLKIDSALDMNSSLAQQIDEATLKIDELTLRKDNVMKKIKVLGGRFDPHSKLGRELQVTIDSIDELTKQRNVLKLTQEANAKSIEDLKTQQADATAKSKTGKPYQKQMGRTKRWWVEIDGKQVMISDDVAASMGANVKGKTTPTKTSTTVTAATPDGAPGTVADDVPVKTPSFLGNLWDSVKSSPLMKGAKVVAGGAMKVADVVARKVLIPLEIVRGMKAGWTATEGEDWDMRVGGAIKGGIANTADLMFTDTLRGIEAISGLVGDVFSEGEWGSTKVDLGSSWLKGQLEEKVGAFKTDTTLESMLESGEVSWLDLLGIGKGGQELYTDKLWNLKMDTTRGGLKKMLDERKALRDKVRRGEELTPMEMANLSIADQGGAIGTKMKELAVAHEKAVANMEQKTAGMSMSAPPVGVSIDKSNTQVVGKSSDVDPMLGYIIPATIKY